MSDKDKNLANLATGEWSASESHSDKLTRKSKENPFVPIGIAGTIAACIYGAYKYKHRGSMSTSVYLMQLRVTAQSMVVGAITVGVAYALFKDYFFSSSNNESGNDKSN